MQNILKNIEDIAHTIENSVFKKYNDFSLNNQIVDFCNTTIKDIFKKNSDIKAIVSKDDFELNSLNKDGKYIISYVSIDNLSLMDLNFSVGSIFTIYEDKIDPSSIVASAYITYGPTFQIVFSKKDSEVEFYFYDGDKFIQKDSIKLEQKGKINSTGGDVSSFTPLHKELMQSFFDEGYRLRFSNSLALDLHQIVFKKGGLYSSPSTKKDQNGILTLVFEAYAVSFIVENLGGKAIDGKNRILEIAFDDIAQRSPIYFGSKYEIDRVEKTYKDI